MTPEDTAGTVIRGPDSGPIEMLTNQAFKVVKSTKRKLATKRHKKIKFSCHMEGLAKEYI